MTEKEKIMYSQMYFALVVAERHINLMHESFCDMMISCPTFSDHIEECEEAVDFLMDTIAGFKEKINHAMCHEIEETEENGR